MKFLNKTQKEKIKEALVGRNLGFFFLWVVIFSFINFYFNEIGDVGFGLFNYPLYIVIPYITSLVFNTILISLSINLIIIRLKDIRNLNKSAGVFSILGTFLALLTGACPGCIAGIFPAFIGIFGSNISLYSLPLYGIELQILSFVFLLIGIYYLSSDIICKIKTKRKPMKKLITIIILSFLASLNAGYLTYNAYLLKASENQFSIDSINGVNSVVGFACDFNSTFSCSSIFTHDFAWLFGIPFSLLALIVYPLILILAFIALKGKIKNIYKILLAIVSGGILFNGYIIINEYFVGVYCLLCLMCTAIIIAIGAISIFGLKEKNTK